MGKISKLIQKIEGYDWEESRDFEVTVISVADNENESYEVTVRQLDEKNKNPVETLVNRLRAYSTDKEIFAITGIQQSEVPYQWHVRLVVDKNDNYDNYVSTEEKKVENEKEDGSDTEEHMEAEAQA